MLGKSIKAHLSTREFAGAGGWVEFSGRDRISTTEVRSVWPAAGETPGCPPKNSRLLFVFFPAMPFSNVGIWAREDALSDLSGCVHPFVRGHCLMLRDVPDFGFLKALRLVNGAFHRFTIGGLGFG